MDNIRALEEQLINALNIIEKLKSSKMDQPAQLPPDASGSDRAALGDKKNTKIEGGKRENHQVLRKPEEHKVSKEELEELERMKREKRERKGEERKATQEKLEKMEKENKILKGELDRRVSKERTDEINKMILIAQEVDLVFLVAVNSQYELCNNLIKHTVAKIKEQYPECKWRVGIAPYNPVTQHISSGSQYDAKQWDLTDVQFTGDGSLFGRALTRGAGTVVFDEYLPSFSWNAINRFLIHIYNTKEEEMLLKKVEKKVSARVARKVGGGAVGGLMLNFHYIRMPPSEQDDDVVVNLCRDKIQETLDAPHDMKYLPKEDGTTLPSGSYSKSSYNKQKWYEDLDELIGQIRNKEAIGVDVVEGVHVEIRKPSSADERACTWQYPATVKVPGEAPMHTLVRRFKTPLKYKDMASHCQKRDYYLAQMEVQSVATQMAREFNRLSSNFTNGKKLEFTRVNLLRVVSGDQTTMFANMDVCEGGHMRSCSNIEAADCDEVLQAFTHWTHQRSEKQLMVRAYLKGAEIMTDEACEGDKIIRLRDPVVHCESDVMRFNTHMWIDTRTNLGSQGFKLFFDTHKCNNVCKSVLPAPSGGALPITTPGGDSLVWI